MKPMALMMMNKKNRDLLNKYKASLKLREAKSKYLLNAHTDWAMLEEFIQDCNNDPNLEVNITLGDGTKIQIKTKQKSSQNRGLDV